MKKKFVTVFIAMLCLCLGTGALMAQAETYSGSCGSNVKWSLDTNTGVLTISGTGEMDSFTLYDSPWYEYKNYIKEVHINDGVKNINEGTFCFYTELESVIIAGSVSKIHNDSFYGCTKLKNIILEDGVTDIGWETFMECKLLENINLPNTMVCIDAWSFCGTNLKNVVIPKNVRNIGIGAFCSCYNLTDISVDSENSHYLSKDGVLFNIDQTTLVQYPAGKVSTCTIPCSVKRIEEYAFHGCKNLKDVYYEGSKEMWNAIEIGEFNAPLSDATIHFNYSDSQVPTVQNDVITISINGNMVDCTTPPYIKNGRTLVPLRAIFEALGAEVSWNNETRTAIGEKDGVVIMISIGENMLYKNGVGIELDAPAEITDNKTMVPVRAISEAFGCKVTWEQETKTIYITDYRN